MIKTKARGSTKQIAHIWAQRTYAQGQSGGSLHFTGTRISSYSKVIGAIMPDGVVLLEAEKFTTTTSRHQSEIAYASNHFVQHKVYGLDKLLWLYDYGAGASDKCEEWLLKTAHAMTLEAVTYVLKLLGSRRSAELTKSRSQKAFDKDVAAREKAFIARRIEELRQLVSGEYIANIITIRGLSPSRDELIEATKAELDRHAWLLKPKSRNKWAARILNPKNADTVAADAVDNALALVLVQAEKLLSDFNAGAPVGRSFRIHGCEVLRRRGDRVETSGGAEVLLRLAIHAYKAIREYEGKEMVFNPPIGVGHFKATEINADGVVTIGCHKIKLSEMKRLYGEFVAAKKGA